MVKAIIYPKVWDHKQKKILFYILLEFNPEDFHEILIISNNLWKVES